MRNPRPFFVSPRSIKTQHRKSTYITKVTPKNVKNKIAIFGAGEVTKQMLIHITSQYPSLPQPLKIVVHNRTLKHSESMLMDLESAFSKPLEIHATDCFADSSNADICVIAIGSNQLKKNLLPLGIQSNVRDLMSLNNLDAVMNIADNIKRYSPNALVIMVTSQPDFMAEQVSKILPRYNVLGFGGAIDSARFQLCLHKLLSATMTVETISGHIIGYHNQDMLALSNSVKINKTPLQQILSKNEQAQLLSLALSQTKAYGLRIAETNNGNTSPSIGPGIKLAEAILQLCYGLNPNYCEPFCCYIDENSLESTIYGINGFVSVPLNLRQSCYEIDCSTKITDTELQLLQTAKANFKRTSENILRELNHSNLNFSLS